MPAVACGLAAVVFCGAASGANRTTEPGKALLVYVSITDKGISNSFWSSSTVSGQETLFVLQPGQVRRGTIAYFVVTNHGKRVHDFKVLGKKTPKIAPGKKAHFHLMLTQRGAFPYTSTLDKGKRGFRGIFTVY
jgi:uncharacterized cupredoxin-like copper-binding protein